MVQNKLNELFETIKNSKEYLAYQSIGEVLNNNSEVNDLVKEIKELQQKSVRLEESNDLSYKEIDKIIEEKVKTLNSIPVYQEYLRRMDEFNDVVSMSSKTIEKYLEDKI